MSGPVARPIEDRFWPRVNKTETCWLWTGYLCSRGYPRFMSVVKFGSAKCVGAHRWAWEQENGSVPDGLELDHLCRTPACINPAHLEPVTHAENVRRAAVLTVACPQGHPYDDRNTSYHNGKRRCRACAARRARERRLAARTAVYAA